MFRNHLRLNHSLEEKMDLAHGYTTVSRDLQTFTTNVVVWDMPLDLAEQH